MSDNPVSALKLFQRLRRHKLLGFSGAATLLLLAFFLLTPDMSRYENVSRVVVASNGAALRTYLTPDGMVRLHTTPRQVNPAYLALLVTYEDKRFFHHHGVDALSLGRAVWQTVTQGQVVSGGSTLTMQVVRLLEPRPRTVVSKLIEIIRAWQLEARYAKTEILGMYLTLAPMGGNLEGVEAAARNYFRKPARMLTVAESAALIALPQSPARLRRNMPALTRARAKILTLAGRKAGIRPADLLAAARTSLTLRDVAQGFSAPLLADRVLADRVLAASTGTRASTTISTTLNARLQRDLERKTAIWLRSLDPQASLGLLVVDIKTRRVQAYVGSADFSANARDGQVDMVTAIRSPGSALKPFIYARAFEDGLAHPMTLVDDVETRFGSYAPANFEDQYHGRVTLADGLRLSLNVPAVLLLDRIGPVNFTEYMRDAGLVLQLPRNARPGLPIALGGVGVSLENMAASYAALADDGIIRPLVLQPGLPGQKDIRDPFAGEQTRRWIAGILRGAPPPDGVPATSPTAHAISLKTGTSYGYRDAWAFGYDARHVVAVWTGRPDGTPSPGRFGVNTAAPILYDVFELVGIRAPRGAPDIGLGAQLAPALSALGANGAAPGRSLKIAYPIDGTTLPWLPGKALPLEVRGGKSPFRWIANGASVGEASPGQSLMWLPDGPGFHTLTVVDGIGRSASARIRINPQVSFVQ